MDRLIDADALKHKLLEYFYTSSHDYHMTICEINSAPTVDAVPVVRCRYCRNDCGIVGKSFGPNGYCSMGRKKMEGGE